MAIKIVAKGYRMPPAESVAVGERPTHAQPFCKCRHQTKKLLEQPVQTLTELQRRHYAAAAMRCC